ncbi:GIY-YIG nuclease family protein [Desemzia incerta]|uniref:GIY-YIG nuclease family protein n=1 Tax=Desemzia incerta TaxID=82801 RepID=UPI003CFE56F4
MNNKAITIQMFYPTGDTRGFRIAEVTNTIIEALLVPRKELEQILSTREELKSSGIYFLFGKDTDDINKKVEAYIGESEVLCDRLRKHNKEKDFWDVAVVFISSNQRWQLNKADIKHLEHVSYNKAMEARRYSLNQTIPKLSEVTEAREADLNALIEIIEILLSALGYPLFKALVTKEEKSDKNEQIFYMTSRNSDAKGIYTNEGFVVLSGSKITTKEKGQSFNKNHLLVELKDNRILNEEGEFKEDFLFSSPSTAASIIGKAKFNGWTVWKNKLGKTLDEIYRIN